MWWWLLLASADMPSLQDGELTQRSCDDEGRCAGWFEGPSMGGCMATCCHTHMLWVGSDGSDGRLLQLRPSETAAPYSGSPHPHPVAVQRLGEDRLATWVRAPLLPFDDPMFDAWSLTGFRGWGLVRRSYRVEGDSAWLEDESWVHEGDAIVARTLASFAPQGTAGAPEPTPRPTVRTVLQGQCGSDHVVAGDTLHAEGLWFVGGRDGSDASVECIVVTREHGASVETIHRGDAAEIRRDTDRTCVTGVVDGIRGAKGGMACFDNQRPGAMATADVSGWTVSGADRYPLRPWPDGTDATEALGQALTVLAADPDRVEYGAPRWSGPTDLSLSWRAARIGDDLVLQARVTDDAVELGLSPGADHLELDLWHGERRSGPPAVRLAMGSEAEPIVRRWRWDGEEVDAPSVGTATVTRRDGGYDVLLRLPEEGGPKADGELTVAVRASDGEGGQTVVAGQSTWTWDETWPPAVAPF